MSQICNSCQHSNLDIAIYCANCGSKLSVKTANTDEIKKEKNIDKKKVNISQIFGWMIASLFFLLVLSSIITNIKKDNQLLSDRLEDKKSLEDRLTTLQESLSKVERDKVSMKEEYERKLAQVQLLIDEKAQKIYEAKLLADKKRIQEEKKKKRLAEAKKKKELIAKKRKLAEAKKKEKAKLAEEKKLAHQKKLRAKSKILKKIAKKNLGKHYIRGAIGPYAFDCSGFTSYVYKKKGIYIPRTVREQSKYGSYVKRKQLRPGDLIFFDTSRRSKGIINHVGMYLGNNKFIHASFIKKRVVITSLSKPFYARCFKWGRRIIN